jgi:hypothetical protein
MIHALKREAPGGRPAFRGHAEEESSLRSLLRSRDGSRALAGMFSRWTMLSSQLVSRQAIAAALALEDLTGGERLVAFSLASFAARDGRTWPGAPAAAARAGLSRSRYLYDRERLVQRRLVNGYSSHCAPRRGGPELHGCRLRFQSSGFPLTSRESWTQVGSTPP